MLEVNVNRDFDKQWVTMLTNGPGCAVTLFSSKTAKAANVAEDIAQDVRRAIGIHGIHMTARAERQDGGTWESVLYAGTAPMAYLRPFGSSSQAANRAQDFSEAVNRVIRGEMSLFGMGPDTGDEPTGSIGLASAEMPAVPVPGGGLPVDGFSAPVYETDDGKGNSFEGEQP